MLTEALQRTGNREAGWVNRLFSNEVYTADHQELKFTLHRKLLAFGLPQRSVRRSPGLWRKRRRPSA
jgi:hypothetical protein